MWVEARSFKGGRGMRGPATGSGGDLCNSCWALDKRYDRLMRETSGWVPKSQTSGTSLWNEFQASNGSLLPCHHRLKWDWGTSCLSLRSSTPSLSLSTVHVSLRLSWVHLACILGLLQTCREYILPLSWVILHTSYYLGVLGYVRAAVVHSVDAPRYRVRCSAAEPPPLRVPQALRQA